MTTKIKPHDEIRTWLGNNFFLGLHGRLLVGLLVLLLLGLLVTALLVRLLLSLLFV
jgi:hypothetical protein